MRELDALLTGWLDRHYDSASDYNRAKFESLLDMQDPELMRLINTHSDSGITEFNNMDNPLTAKERDYETIINQMRALHESADQFSD